MNHDKGGGQSNINPDDEGTFVSNGVLFTPFGIDVALKDIATVRPHVVSLDEAYQSQIRITISGDPNVKTIVYKGLESKVKEDCVLEAKASARQLSTHISDYLGKLIRKKHCAV